MRASEWSHASEWMHEQQQSDGAAAHASVHHHSPSGDGAPAAHTSVHHDSPWASWSALHTVRRLGRQVPSLLDELMAMDVEEMAHVNQLYAELTTHTAYLTESGGAPGKARATLRFALEVAYVAHRGQKRRSGEAFIIHPVAVACILAQSKMDLCSLTAGLLHDTVEDTVLTFDDVAALFGHEVRQIVEGETKVSKLPKVVRAQLGEEGNGDTSQSGARRESHESPSQSSRDKQAENLRSMFIAMADDWRIVVVKLADRLHNMRTLQYMPPHKRVAIARETLEIFAPLAHRLGMWQFKTELADLSFAYLFPEEHEQLKVYIESKAMGYRAAMKDAGKRIRTLLAEDEWLTVHGRVAHVAIEGRTKSIHSTWRKMQRRDCRVEAVHDLLALRIVLDLDESVTGAGEPAAGGGTALEQDAAAICYHVLSRVHGCWTPMPRTIKDYISSPKPNGYASLHTTVLIGSGAGAHEEGAQPLEIQIRTSSMHAIAEHGAAAHWSYSGDGASLPWRTAIRAWEAEHQCAHEFMQLVRKELLSSRVFIFTEGGRILDLALGATLADAAAVLGVDSMDTDAGGGEGHYICSHNMCLAADLDTPLSNGDIVCFDSHAAAALTDVSAPAPAMPTRRGEGGAHGALASAPSDAATRAPLGRPQRRSRTSGSHDAVQLLDGCLLDEMRWTVCAHCLPLPGDALVCTLRTASTGVSHGLVHRASAIGSHMSRCKLLRKQLADGSQLLSGGESMCELVEGAFEAGRSLTTCLVVVLRNQPHALLAVTATVTGASLAILDVASRISSAEEATGAFQFRVQLSSLKQLDALTAALDDLPQVLSVQRTTLEMLVEESTNAFWRNAYDGAGHAGV